MANTDKKFLDYAGLSTYDEKIKDYIDTADLLSIKYAELDTNGDNLLLYKVAEPGESDTPDFTIPVGSSSLDSLIKSLGTAVGATYNSNTNSYSISFSGAGITSSTSAVAALNTVANEIGTIGNLNTTEKSNLVGAINEILTDIADLDVAEFALASESNGVVTIKGIKEADGKIAVGTDTTKDVTLAKVATTGSGSDVEYTTGVSVTNALNTLNGDNTTAGSVAKAVKDGIDALDVNEFALASESNDVVTIKGVKEVDGKIAIGTDSTKDVTLGTAAKATVATSAIAESSTDTGLVSAAQVATFVAAEIAGLEGAMHFRGVITRQTGETDAQAIARVITDPEAGDVVVMSDNAKEYIYESSTIGWKEVGDETEFVKKTTTIAGVDLEDNISQSELQTALGLGSAAYEAATAFDAAGTAAGLIEALDTTESQTAGTDGLALSITQADGLITGISGSIASGTYDAYGAASSAVAALDVVSPIAFATYTAGQSGAADTIVINGGVKETDGLIQAGGGDTITLATITESEINSLFS